MKYSTDMNYIKIISEGFYHYGQNTPKIETYDQYRAFVGSADATKVYEVDSWDIGLNGIDPISINSETEVHIQIGKEVTKYLLGQPVAFKDTRDKEIVLTRLNNII